MRKFEVIFLFLFVLAAGFCAASVEVHNLSFKESYVVGDVISGEVNLSISGEDFLSIVKSSDGQNISLEDFLDDNGAAYDCEPFDCSNNYDELGVGISKAFNILNGEDSYFGFVFEGEEISIASINFSFDSNFEESLIRPLSMDFFESEPWDFNQFSDNFGGKSRGCYDVESAVQGPLIGTQTYCEKISLSETGSIFTGAEVDNSDTKNLEMVLYAEDGGSSLGECAFNPGTQEGCRIDADSGEVFSAGNYFVCARAPIPTSYHLYEENSGSTCGFVYSSGIESSVKDYGIFASVALYADSDSLSLEGIDFEELALAADDLIESRYERDCSNKCFLPVKVKGVSQNLSVSNVNIYYLKGGEDHLEKNIYDLEVVPAMVDFLGVLDLGLTGFEVSEEGRFMISIGEEEIFEEDLEIIPAPIIKTLMPQNPAAGVPVIFFASVDFNSSSNLTYSWDFGDGVKEMTNEPSVIHAYEQIKNYTLTLEVSAGGNLTSKKKFEIKTISPKEAVNSSLVSMRKNLEDAVKKVNTFPSWYQDDLEKLINLSFYDSELDRLEKANENADDDADYLKIAIDLFSMDIPVNVYVSEEARFPLMTKLDDINPGIIDSLSGGADESEYEDYKNPILRWQTTYVDSDLKAEKISVLRYSGDVEDVMSVYNIQVTAKDSGENYFVINKPLTDLYFNIDPGFRKVDDSSVLILDDGKETNFEFYYKATDEASFFVSPKLSALVLEADIDKTCNQNSVCEKENGENSKNCRSDCKPTKKMVLYIILIIVFGIFLYTILEIWYRRHYENYLFGGDTRQMYNLLMYVTNARARGILDKEILKNLRGQGWSSERVNYVIRKSLGKRTGLPELIPIEKIAARIRRKRAERNIVTGAQQQFGRNINKYSFQGPI